MATIVKTNWKRKDAVGGDTKKPAKSSSDEDRCGGDSPGRNMQKRRSAHSSTAPPQSKAKRGAKHASPSPVLSKHRGEKREKQPTATDSVRSYPKPSRSKSSSPDRAHHSPQRKTPELPPYIRATIAEQLAPARSRPAREDTKENLFGQGQKPKLKLSSARSRENTQNTIFGEPEPLLVVRKSSRHLADTKNNLFGPPPEVPMRPKSRQRPDTPDILSHEVPPQSDVRETQLKTIVSRYMLRHQDTHQKLFGAPETLRKPPPPKTTSNIFYHDMMETHQDKAVKSLPLSSLIVTREVQPPPVLPLEISQS